MEVSYPSGCLIKGEPLPGRDGGGAEEAEEGAGGWGRAAARGGKHGTGFDCPQCGGRRKVLAEVTARAGVRSRGEQLSTRPHCLPLRSSEGGQGRGVHPGVAPSRVPVRRAALLAPAAALLGRSTRGTSPTQH